MSGVARAAKGACVGKSFCFTWKSTCKPRDRDNRWSIFQSWKIRLDGCTWKHKSHAFYHNSWNWAVELLLSKRLLENFTLDGIFPKICYPSPLQFTEQRQLKLLVRMMWKFLVKVQFSFEYQRFRTNLKIAENLF